MPNGEELKAFATSMADAFIATDEATALMILRDPRAWKPEEP